MFLRFIICALFLWQYSAYAEDVQQDNSKTSKNLILEGLEADASSLYNRYETPIYQSWDDPLVEIHRERKPTPFGKAIADIKNDPKLQNDPDIQNKLVTLYKHHPYTYIKTSALAALPLTHPEHDAFNNDGYFYSNIQRIHYGAISKKINADIGYCAYGKPLKSCTSCTDEETEALTPTQQGRKMKNIRVSARKVEGGKLVGYSNFLTKRGFGYYSDFGKKDDLGLYYIPKDDSLQAKFIYPKNIRYISHRKEDGSFWGITSSPGNCGSSYIVKIAELERGKFNVKTHRPLPGSVEGVGEGENGDLYIYFGDEKSETLMCRPNIPVPAMPMEIGPYHNNPPLILTAEGQVYSACQKDAKKF